MLHYRDMTFCTGAGCLNFDVCPRALTPAVRADAARWWGGPDAPISQYADPTELTCYDEPKFDPTQE
jgi:hypothetical protein